jgi:hypothetical protein
MGMNRQKLAVILAGGLILGSSQGQENNKRFEAVLNGTKVVPGPVETAMKGRARFSFATDFSRMAYRLRVRNGTNITSAQLHCAPAGITGPVVADLLNPVTGSWSGPLDISAALTSANIVPDANCASTIGQNIVDLADLATAMANRRIYVDVQSAAFSEGEIRGQTKTLQPAPPTPTPTGTPRGPQITGISTPIIPPPAVVVFPGNVAVPITPAVPFLPPSFPGTTTVTISSSTFGVPVTLLNPSFAGFVSGNAVLSIPSSRFTIVGGSRFIIPAASLTFPSVLNPSSTFNPPTSLVFNPPSPGPEGFFSGATVVTIPATSVNIRIALRTVSSSLVPATAVLTIPSVTWQLSSIPNSLPATLAISQIGGF